MLKRRYFRKWPNYLAACASEFARPLLQAQARFLSKGKRLQPSQWRKGLLIGANHLGDVLYTSASLEALKSGLPDCEWDFVAGTPADQLLQGNPFIRKIHPWDWMNLSDSEIRQAQEELRSESYDVAMCYDTGNAARALRFVLPVGIPNLAAYIHKGFSGWVTHPIQMTDHQPYPAHFRNLVQQLSGVRSPSLRPKVYLSASDRLESDRYLEQNGFHPNQPALACFFTTRQPLGLWPLAYFEECLIRIVEANPCQVFLCGAPSDRPLLEAVASRLPFPSVVNAGDLKIREVVAFLEKMQGVFTADSGPRHLANAAGTPVVFVRNLWFPSAEAGPYCDTEVDVVPPEWESLPPEQMPQYWAKIDKSSVVARVSGLLDSPARSAG